MRLCVFVKKENKKNQWQVSTILFTEIQIKSPERHAYIYYTHAYNCTYKITVITSQRINSYNKNVKRNKYVENKRREGNIVDGKTEEKNNTNNNKRKKKKKGKEYISLQQVRKYKKEKKEKKNKKYYIVLRGKSKFVAVRYLTSASLKCCPCHATAVFKT